MFSHSQPSPLYSQRLRVDVLGPDEAVIGAPARGRSLHVYRLGPVDWLVSEVGSANEGRGPSLRDALAALAARVTAPDWWELAVETLAVDEEFRAGE